MTQEEKQLLLKDLCARLPYGVSARFCYGVKEEIDDVVEIDMILGTINSDYIIDDVKPYLRPMSSMTEEEKMQLKEEHSKDTRLFAEALTKAAAGDTSMRGKVIPHFAADWCNKNHFDYRGLIPMGLALEAPKDMYKTE